MTKKIYFCSLAAIIAVAFSACSTNRVNPSQETTSFILNAENINSIDVSASIKIVYSQAEKTTVSVECPVNLTDRLSVGIKNGQLKAGFKSNTNINGNSRVTITVTAPSLKSIEASSASRFEMSGALIQHGDLSIEASSAATVSLYRLSLNNLDIEASSSASIEIGGVSANEIEVEATSASRAALDDIRCNNLEADASSAASISLSGTAKATELSASSASTINANGLKSESVIRQKTTSGAKINQ